MINNKEMNQDLLKEFLITQYDGNLVISATDYAYHLLGLAEKKRTLKNGMIVDSIPNWYYIVAFLNFLKNNYCIDGLVRVSNGNSHDASFETEVYIFNDGGFFKNELNKYEDREPSLYEDKPVIIKYNKLTEKIIEEYANGFDLTANGEGERLIYCSSADGSAKFIYKIENCSLLGTAADKKYEYDKNNIPNNYNLCRIYLKKHID